MLESPSAHNASSTATFASVARTKTVPVSYDPSTRPLVDRLNDSAVPSSMFSDYTRNNLAMPQALRSELVMARLLRSTPSAASAAHKVKLGPHASAFQSQVIKDRNEPLCVYDHRSEKIWSLRSTLPRIHGALTVTTLCQWNAPPKFFSVIYSHPLSFHLAMKPTDARVWWASKTRSSSVWWGAGIHPLTCPSRSRIFRQAGKARSTGGYCFCGWIQRLKEGGGVWKSEKNRAFNSILEKKSFVINLKSHSLPHLLSSIVFGQTQVAWSEFHRWTRKHVCFKLYIDKQKGK